MTRLVPVDILGGAVRAAGIVELEPTDTGIVLHRLPSWAHEQHNDIALPMLETMPSGGRLELVTDATTIELDVDALLLQLLPEPVLPAAFDLVVDGELFDGQQTTDGTTLVMDRRTEAFDIQPGRPTTIRFDGLPSGEKNVELWLPNAAAVRLRELRVDGTARAPEPGTARRWVHYGSSISHCLEATRPTGVWPVVAARLAGVDVHSFAFAGQCQLDPFVARAIGDRPADLISLKLGINLVNADSMRERTFVPALHGFLDLVRDRHPDVPLVVVTPIHCPVAEDHPGPTGVDQDNQCTVTERPDALALGALTLRRVRELEAEVVASRRTAGDTNLHLVQGPDLFGPDDARDLPDGLHPNPTGYQRIGERFHALAFEGDGPFCARG
jgi:lysophospholipase L1-like esterase